MKYDWKSKESEAAKQKIIGKEWGTVLEGGEQKYLMYGLGNIAELTREEREQVTKDFFPDAKDVDIEIFPSRLTRHYMILRLRSNQLVLRSSLMLRGNYCPLHQVGYSHAPGHGTPDMINFQILWPAQKRMSVTPSVIAFILLMVVSTLIWWAVGA